MSPLLHEFIKFIFILLWSIYHSVCIKIVYPFRIFYVVMDKNFNKIFYIYRDEKKNISEYYKVFIKHIPFCSPNKRLKETRKRKIQTNIINFVFINNFFF